jgi:GR25 family glycosyltransferase involved in LPS biosynthesis
MKQSTLFLIILFILIALILIYFSFKKDTVFEKTVRIEKELKKLVKEIDIYNRLYPRKQMITIPVYYINMDKSKDRNEWMIEQLSKNVERYYRVSGVNGYEIKNKEHDTVDGVEFYNDFKELTIPEIGCTLSHLKAIQTAYENGENIAIIMEDDVYVDMTNLIDDSVEELVKNAPEELEILQLVHLGSNLNKSSKIFKQYTFHPHTRGNYESCTSSYLINRKGMENILKRLGRNPYYLDINTSDSGVSDCIIYDNATTFIVEPSILTPIHTQIDLERSLNILKIYKKPIVIKGSTLKILNLIIYNENEEYERQMKHELQIYLKQFENNVIFYFIAYRETQKDYITIEDNCIYIKGKEGFVPQVLDKTIIALEYCIKNLNINFDFFVRSNISSVINFNLFPINELDYTNVYTSASILTLMSLDPSYGINSKNFHRLKGLKYAGGTNIIISKSVAEYLIKHQDKLDRTLIDDVSIGVFLSAHFKIKELKNPNKFVINTIDKDAFVIRNKSENRYDDIFRMRRIRLQQYNQYDVGVLAIFKNEEMIIEEWIEHYIWQGVEHFYMIDNGSTDGSKNKLIPYIDRGIITYYYLPEKHKQSDHYNYVYNNRSKKECKWLIICDIDEYIYNRQKRTIKDYLNALNYNDVGAILIHWTMFGSNGFIKQPPNIRKSFIYGSKNNYDKNFNNHKSIINTLYTNHLNIHDHIHTHSKNIIKYPSELKLNHYAIMSLEYFQKVKMKRGDVSTIHSENIRDMNYFYNYDQNDVLDDELASLL